MRIAVQPEVRMIAAGEFKAKCLQLMDEVNSGKLTLIITKHGKPVSHLVPPPQEATPFRSIFGRTQSVRLPNEKEWAKAKAQWADDWDESTRNLASVLNGKPKKSKGK